MGVIFRVAFYTAVEEKLEQAIGNHNHPAHDQKSIIFVVKVVAEVPELFQIMKNLVFYIPPPVQNSPDRLCRNL